MKNDPAVYSLPALDVSISLVAPLPKSHSANSKPNPPRPPANM